MAKILSIHAHPDDAEIFAGGTLALLAQAGHEITICTMSPGDCGSREYSPERTAEVRRAEAAESAASIGALYRCAEFRDLSIFVDNDARRRVTAIVRQERPDIVLTASPVDYLCDHEATSILVRDACFASPAPNYRTPGDDLALDTIPHLYFMDAMGGVDREGNPIYADFVVNVASTIEQKIMMLACHRSQREWLRAQHGIDEYIHMMQAWTRECGARVHIEFGEGFRRYKGHPYPQTALLEELLGDHVVVPR